MKFNKNNKYFKWGITAFAVIAAAIVFYYFIFQLSTIIRTIKSIVSVIMPVMMGLVIAYLMTPILNFLEKSIINPLLDRVKIKQGKTRNKWVRGFSVLLTSVLAITFIYILIYMMISQIVPSIQNIVVNFDSYIDNVTNWLNDLLEDNADLRNVVLPLFNKVFAELEVWMEDTASLIARSGELLRTVSLSIIGFFKFLWNFIIGFIIAIYVLCSKEVFSGQGKKLIYAMFSKDNANSVLSSMRFVHRTFSGFISGKVLDSIIIGILCFIGTSIMGTPYAALISVVIGVTNVIPFFGPYLGAIPSALLLLIVDLTHPMTVVSFIIFVLILQQVDGNLIGPKILGNSTGLSGFWVIFSITVFGGFFGVPGMIVGVPIFAVIFAAIRGLANRSLTEKSLPIESAKYEPVKAVDEEGNLQVEVEEKDSHSQKQTSWISIIKGKLSRKDKSKKDSDSEEK